MRKKPDLVIVVDGQMMHKFVKELMSTKTRGIVLTSSNFDLYADVQTVMCNVNSQRSLDFVMNAIVGKGE